MWKVSHAEIKLQKNITWIPFTELYREFQLIAELFDPQLFLFLCALTAHYCIEYIWDIFLCGAGRDHKLS